MVSTRTDTQPTGSQLERLTETLESRTFVQGRRMLNGLPGPDIADHSLISMAGGLVLTAVTNAVGLFTFLGLATLFYA